MVLMLSTEQKAGVSVFVVKGQEEEGSPPLHGGGGWLQLYRGQELWH